jgi:FPC/CPF motif-containing protein YcgG
MNRTKEELLFECIKQFEHIEDVLGFNRLSTTRSLIREIEQALRIHDVVGRSEQLVCDCGNPNLTWYGNDDDKTYFCFECKKEVTN